MVLRYNEKKGEFEEDGIKRETMSETRTPPQNYTPPSYEDSSSNDGMGDIDYGRILQYIIYIGMFIAFLAKCKGF